MSNVSKKRTLNLHIVGRNLPSLRYSVSSDVMVDREPKPVYIGIQRENEVVDLVPGNASEAVFNFNACVVLDHEAIDSRGPFAHLAKGRRFLYLSWGELGSGGSFFVFWASEAPEVRGYWVSPISVPVAECTLDLTDERGGSLSGTTSSYKTNWRIAG